MPGSEQEADLIRVKDERSNSKADTFFISPKAVGKNGQTESIRGDVNVVDTIIESGDRREIPENTSQVVIGPHDIQGQLRVNGRLEVR